MTELEKLCAAKGITIETKFLGIKDGAPKYRAWTCTLVREFGFGKAQASLETAFSQGTAHTEPPTVGDVRSCLISDANVGAQTFDEFCSDLGYDTDSRKAHAIWIRCAEVAPKVRAFLGDDFDAFANAEH